MKRTVEFLDADRKKVVAECEITERNGYPEFTMSGDYGGGLGQVFDHVNPDGENQKKLIELWHKWHLNGLNAGTPAQMEALKKPITDSELKQSAVKMLTIKEWNRLDASIRDYWKKTFDSDGFKTYLQILHNNRSHAGLPEVSDEEVVNLDVQEYCNNNFSVSKVIAEADEFLKDEFLNKKYAILNHFGLLYDIHPATGEQYKYGSGWIKNDLPEDFEDELDSLLDDIEAEEEEKQDRPVEDTDIDLFQDFNESECALALALMLDLCVNEIEDIVEEGNNRWCVQGTDYLAGTDEEMDELWDEDLDNYLEECVYPDLPENMRNYFDDDAWKRDARYDGRGHSLNRYDGGELEQQVDGVYYYAYRQ